MTTSFYNGIGGMKTSQVGIDVLGDNIANINTVGYKQQQVDFSTLFSNSLYNASSPVSSDIGYASTAASTVMDLSQGSIQQTDSVFDMAIEGKGWMAVKDQNDQLVYTKTTSFSRDRDGTLVSDDGSKLQVVNAHNLKFDGTNWKFDATIPTDNLISNSPTLSSISLPENIIFPPQPTTSIKIGGNLANQDIAPTPKLAQSNNDFGVLYDTNAQNMNIKDGQDVVFGFGDNIYYDNGIIKYDMCIFDDEVDGNDVNIDFDVNGKNIKLTLPDGSSSEDIINALTQELDKNGILYSSSNNLLQLQNSEKLIIKNNDTSFVNSASMQKLVYSTTTNEENSFTTIQDFVDKLNNLATNTYQDVNVVFEDGKISVNNNSNTDIKAILDKTDNSNDMFISNLDMLGNIVKPLSSSSSLTFNQNYQGFSGVIVDNNGNRNDLQFDFYKTKLSDGVTTWNLTITEIDPNGNIISTKNQDITFDQIGGLLTPSTIDIDNNGITTTIDLGGAFSGITSIDKANVGFVYSQDGYEEGYLVDYDVNENGEIIANFSNSKSGVLAQIPIYHFQNEQGLDSLGSGKFTPTSNSGEAFFYNDMSGKYLAGAKVVNYSLEMSNVNMGQAMTELIVMQKAFDANSKSITTSDQMIQKAIDMKR